jgi:serine protease Do
VQKARLVRLALAFVSTFASSAPAQTPAPTSPAPPAAQRAPAQPAPPPAQRAPAPPPAQRAPAPTAPSAPGPAQDPLLYAPGVVTLERAGKYLGLGTILNGDGRIVTAFSALGGAQNVDARYSDGTLVPARLGHADRGRDLALLVPQNSRHKLGMRASRKAGAGAPATLRSFAPSGGRVIAGAALATTGPSTLANTEGKALPDMIALATAVPASSVGSPLLDDTSEVVAIVTRACKRAPGSGCTPVLAGTPVGAVRDFLSKVPASAAIPVASIGVQGAADDAGSARGVRVASARGPALSAGLRAGQDARSADVIVALDGVPVTTPEALNLGIEQRAVGDSVDLLVLGAGRYRHVTLIVVAGPVAAPAR